MFFQILLLVHKKDYDCFILLNTTVANAAAATTAAKATTFEAITSSVSSSAPTTVIYCAFKHISFEQKNVHGL
jgi:hypothetical protein